MLEKHFIIITDKSLEIQKSQTNQNPLYMKENKTVDDIQKLMAGFNIQNLS